MAMFVLGRGWAILGVVGVNGFTSGVMPDDATSFLGEEGTLVGSGDWGIGGKGSCGGCVGGGSAATCAGVYWEIRPP
jgi:hypothetical protein